MARNKHPEQTVQLILDTAAQLFFQKGYDRTIFRLLTYALTML